MADLIQTYAAPDLLRFDKTEEDHPIARMGTTVAYITPLRETLVAISRADLAALCKSAYSLGWAGKCTHVRSLMEKLPAEIGT